MYQATPEIWNEIAASQKLATLWAKRLFPLKGIDQHKALEAESRRLATEGVSNPSVRAAFVQMAPLLWERKAIAKFVAKHPSLTASLPNVEDAQEAAMLASMDRPLTMSDQQQLIALLELVPQSESSVSASKTQRTSQSLANGMGGTGGQAQVSDSCPVEGLDAVCEALTMIFGTGPNNQNW